MLTLGYIDYLGIGTLNTLNGSNVIEMDLQIEHCTFDFSYP